jgi:hypothetical protein
MYDDVDLMSDFVEASYCEVEIERTELYDLAQF